MSINDKFIVQFELDQVGLSARRYFLSGMKNFPSVLCPAMRVCYSESNYAVV